MSKLDAPERIYINLGYAPTKRDGPFDRYGTYYTDRQEAGCNQSVEYLSRAAVDKLLVSVWNEAIQVANSEHLTEGVDICCDKAYDRGVRDAVGALIAAKNKAVSQEDQE